MQYPHLYANFRKVQADLEAATDTIKAYESRNKELASKGLAYKQLYMQMQTQLGVTDQHSLQVKPTPDADGWTEVTRKPNSKQARSEAYHAFHGNTNKMERAHHPDHKGRTELVIPKDQREVFPHPDRKTHFTVTDPRQVVVAPVSRPYRAPILPIGLMVKEFNDYWLLETGKNIKFKFYDDNVSTLSATEPSRTRNMFLRKFFYYRPVVMNVFSGVGGDLITELYDLDCRDVIAVQLMPSNPTVRDTRVFKTLKDNVNNFLAQFPVFPADQVQYVSDSIQEYLVRSSCTYIDFLSLDPPWILDDNTTECSPRELIDFLEQTVFSMLKAHFIVAKVISIKSRFGWKELDGIMDMESIASYKRVVTIEATPFDGTYYYHCIALDIPEHAMWIPSNVQNRAYPRATKRRGRAQVTDDKQVQPGAHPGFYSDPNRRDTHPDEKPGVTDYRPSPTKH
jgi:hypothetical protein